MNENEFDLTARAWLEDGPTRMPDRGLQSALEEIHATRQRRAVWPAWRAARVSLFAGVALAAVLVVAVGVLTVNVLPRQPDGFNVGGPPSPSSTADSTPRESSLASPVRGYFPTLTDTFVSPRNGFSVNYFPRGNGTVTRATDLWDPGTGQIADNVIDDGVDAIETGYAAVFLGSSAKIPDGVSIDEWLDQVVAPSDCGGPRSQQAEIVIDGQQGRASQCQGKYEATVVQGGRLYLFTLWSDRTDATAFFNEFAATIDLTPETAVNVP